MRAVLTKLYQLSGAVSGVCIVTICIVILVRVIGRWVGVVIPSSDDIVGYLLAAASFLALAYALNAGTHIRVSLFTSRLSAGSLLHVERLVLTIASLLVAFLAYQLGFMVWESWHFDEVTSGYIPMPLWLVQLPLALGSLLFAVAMAELAYDSWRHRKLLPKSEEEELVEHESIDLTTGSGDHHE